jgi:uncharacterized protein involved in exopolysaccharide biosynthesis
MAQPPGDEEGVDLLLAVRRHAVAFIAPIVVGVVVLGGYGLLRDPHYTAESRLSVGRLDVQTQGLPGFTQAGELLGAAFARAIDAPAITRPAGRAAGVSTGAAADALSASPIPSSPLIRIEARRRDKGQAITLANAASQAMVTYARRLGTAGGTAPELLARYTTLTRQATRLRLKRDQLAAAYRRRPGDARRVALQRATGKLAATELERNAASAIYGARQATGSTASLLGVLVPAVRASSDRRTTTLKLALTGGIAGLVVGLGLAAWSEAGSRRRRTAPLRSAA